ncbi:acyltransferase [Kitasatospora arboriphila]|uniref:acyltransferase family protein n=1 Tax=Kitasatospora arboriphila TaxID=258052 RepID=UPI0031DBD0C3
MDRVRYVDFLRGAAIVMVVLGHWVITALVRHPDGTIAAPELLATVEWTQWLTLLFQIMPVFFLAGGHVAAGSWRRHREGGGGAAGWVRARAVRLLLPTAAYVGIAVPCLAAGRTAGADPGLLGMVGWALAMQFWFLPVYLVVSALTPWLYAAYRRWGLASTAALAGLSLVADLVDLADRGSPVGAAGYVLVWAVAYQLGFGWEDGRLPGRRPLLWAVAGGGAAAFAGLVAFGPYPVSLIRVSTEELSNTDPPSPAMLAWVLAQCALCLLAAPAMERALRAEWLWRLVRPLGRVSMTLYLWHMVPVLAAAAAFYLTDLAPEPVVGSGAWWAWRPVWIAVLTLFLLGLLVALRPVERGLLRVGGAVRPQAEVRQPYSVLAGLAGLAAAVWTLTVWAGEGLARTDAPAGWTVAGFAAGTALVLLPPPRAVVAPEASEAG